jgi:glycosyltransferase involved in cell wall biosynthesis
MGDRRRGVSVVIPTRNRRELLEVTLAAVLDQLAVDLEVVVVDDGSDVPVAAVINNCDARVRVVRHPTSRGVAAARNTGIDAARYPWLAFTDDDDVWAPDKLTSQLDALSERSSARWSCVGDVQVDDELHVFQNSEPPAAGDVADLVLVTNPIPGGASGVVADTELVRSLHGFDESLSMCADYDLWIRLGLAGPVASVNRPLVAYRVHAGGMSRQLDRVHEELRFIGAKYAHERARRGLTVEDGIHLWIADRHQRSGHRVAAARAYLRATSATGTARAVGRAAEALVWPGAYHLRDERRARSVPDAWMAETETWLAPRREQEANAHLSVLPTRVA